MVSHPQALISVAGKDEESQKFSHLWTRYGYEQTCLKLLEKWNDFYLKLQCWKKKSAVDSPGIFSNFSDTISETVTNKLIILKKKRKEKSNILSQKNWEKLF